MVTLPPADVEGLAGFLLFMGFLFVLKSMLYTKQL
jgi:hypothetical protein